jgi:uncharacterized membrane protein
MEQNAINKFFMYAIVISFLISTLVVIYLTWEIGKDLATQSGPSATVINYDASSQIGYIE